MMKHDTAGNKIIEPIPNCDCGLTGGCEKCNPSLWKSQEYNSEPKKQLWGVFKGLKVEEYEIGSIDKIDIVKMLKEIDELTIPHSADISDEIVWQIAEKYGVKNPAQKDNQQNDG